jgi:hypothetical protein
VGTTPPPGCSTYTGWSGDGCAGAVGSFEIASYFGASSFYDFATQSGQTWTSSHPWNWNSPGVDYPVGPDPSITLADPATATLPAGCTYEATGNVLTNGPEVYCSRGANNPVINGIDFSLHGCTTFYADSNVTGQITLTNDKFVMGPNCSATNGYLVKLVGGSANMVLQNDLLDEGYPAENTKLLMTGIDVNSSQPLTIENSAYVNASQRPIATISTGPELLENNVFVGMNLGTNASNGEHGEIDELETASSGVTFSNIQYINNVVVIPATTKAALTSPFYADGVPFKNSSIQGFTVDHNVVVTNYINGQNTSATNISGSVTNNVMTVDPGYTGSIAVNLTMIYKIGTTTDAATILSQTGPNQYTLSYTSQVGYPLQGDFTGGHTLNTTTQSALISMGWATSISGLTITNNFVDPIGSIYCMLNNGVPDIGSPVVSNNISLETGGAISGFTSAVGSAQCPINSDVAIAHSNHNLLAAIEIGFEEFIQAIKNIFHL